MQSQQTTIRQHANLTHQQ